MNILVTGGKGFIGSHIAEFFARKGNNVIVIDNSFRMNLLNSFVKWDFNENYLKKFKNINLVKGDIRNLKKVNQFSKDVDIIFHTAAQVAVAKSIEDPVLDFNTNAVGTFNVLEAARKNDVKMVIYCSTNKVYGENVNKVDIIEKKGGYRFNSEFEIGIPETFSIDLCGHTPYGSSKLCGDIYCQDYAKFYGLKTGVFRMSCIYGPRQLGMEDQGWVAWFVIATLLKKRINIHGNGKQVRDVLYISDLLDLIDRFVRSKIKHGVFNVGGGPENTLSLLGLLDLLYRKTGKKSKIVFKGWRASDQKVYVSDISKVKEALGWRPKIKPSQGIGELIKWVQGNINLFT